MRCELREHKARPDLQLALGEKLPPNPPVITPDYSIPPDAIFCHWDWERSYANRRDPETKSLFEYINIAIHRDDELACWPEVIATVDPPQAELPNSSPMSEELQRPENVSPRVWLAVLAIDEVERQEHIHSTDISQPDLLARARRQMPERSPGKRIPLGMRTLQFAEAYRRGRNKPG
jgi:hypothetical protein